MLRLAYGPAVIAVRSAAEAPLLWLREFLGAPFEDASPSAPSDCTVTLELGASGGGAFDPAGEVDCFSLDGDFIRLPARRGADGSIDMCDGRAGIRYAIRGADVTIQARSDDAASRLALLRSVREIATAHALRRGHVHLHAAAVARAGDVVAIAGPRESGKTTLLLHLLLGGRLAYVTNDRLLVDPRQDPPLARGMATIVSLREETLARFPGFAERLRASGYSRDRTLREAAAAGKPASRPHLSPAQLRALAGAAETGKGPLRAAIFPSLDAGLDRFDLRPLPGPEAASRLRRGLFLATVPERPAAAFDLAAPPRGEVELARACKDLAARVPCLELRLGPRAYEGTALLDAILGRL